jgi:hypothetical protein
VLILGLGQTHRSARLRAVRRACTRSQPLPTTPSGAATAEAKPSSISTGILAHRSARLVATEGMTVVRQSSLTLGCVPAENLAHSGAGMFYWQSRLPV